MLTVSYLLSHNLTGLITGALGHRLSPLSCNHSSVHLAVIYVVIQLFFFTSTLLVDSTSGQASQYLWLHTPQAVFLSELLVEYRHRQNLQNRYSCSSNHALHFSLA